MTDICLRVYDFIEISKAALKIIEDRAVESREHFGDILNNKYVKIYL